MFTDKFTSGVLIGTVAILLALAGCRDIAGVQYLSDQHPANPDARQGRQMPMSNSLVPENLTVRPRLEAAIAAQKPAARNRMNQMDHSMHRGSH